jgi:D-amino-acid dehydrogenase
MIQLYRSSLMKVLVLGAGVIGVSSAYYLARAGHEVTVIDRQPGPALETSFANAGEVSPGYASPWAGPGIPLKAIKWLFMQHAPLVLRMNPDPRMWLWMWRMLLNCTEARYRVNKGRMVRIAEYSRDVLKQLRADTGIAYDERTQGTLQLFRTEKQLQHAAGDIVVLREYGVPYEVLDADGCIGAEPGLKCVRSLIAGGLRLPGDETGDCHLFTTRMAATAAELGVVFRFNTTVTGFERAGDRLDAVITDKGRFTADAYQLSLGSFSPILGRQLGLSLPVYPVKGYSITVPIVDETRAPVSTIMDESYKVAITRLGDRIRVGGMAELSGYNARLDEPRRKTLEQSVSDLFSGAGDLARASFWTGLRPMTPDGTPVIGRSTVKNVFLNTGHGTLGWTMACGSARIVADMIGGIEPEIDVRDLDLSRY